LIPGPTLSEMPRCRGIQSSWCQACACGRRRLPPERGVDLKAYDDALDAISCAWLPCVSCMDGPSRSVTRVHRSLDTFQSKSCGRHGDTVEEMEIGGDAASHPLSSRKPMASDSRQRRSVRGQQDSRRRTRRLTAAGVCGACRHVAQRAAAASNRRRVSTPTEARGRRKLSSESGSGLMATPGFDKGHAKGNGGAAETYRWFAANRNARRSSAAIPERTFRLGGQE
jgi:hypothetical protein